MNSPGGWAQAPVRLLLLTAAIVMVILTACQASPAEYNFSYACLHRSLPPCIAAEEFAARVADRTDGRVQIEITAISDLAVSDDEVLSRLEDGKLDLAEIFSGFLSGDRAVFDMLDLWGLYDDYGTQAQVTEAIRNDIEGIIAERSGGMVLAIQFYPSNYFFAKNPLRTAADMQGLRTRSHSRISEDLLESIGSIANPVIFGEVYQAFQVDQLDAALSCSSCGAGLKWHEVADYLVGPIPTLGHSWITINSQRWSELPLDIQLIIQEEALRLETATKNGSLGVWDELGVQENIAAGMEHIQLTPELKDLMRTATITTSIPRMIEESGGPSSNVVKIFNQKIAPIVGVEITEEGQATDTE